MKKIIFSLFLLCAFQTQARTQCQSLFGAESVMAKPRPGVNFFASEGSLELPVLNLREAESVGKPSLAAIKIIKHAILNSSYILTDKNFVFKDEIILGFPLRGEYSLEVVYTSDSRRSNRFVLDKMTLVTPTGYTQKIASDIFQVDRHELRKSKFNIGDYLLPGERVEADLPFFIEGEILEKLSAYGPALELFTKSELRELFADPSEAKIARKIFFRKAKNLFVKVILKEPFKILAGAVVAFTAFTYENSLKMKDVQPAEQVLLRKEEPDLMRTEFEYKFKKADGTTVNYRVKAKEDRLHDRVDFEVRNIP